MFFLLSLSLEEMDIHEETDDEEESQDDNQLLSWGCGEFGQHCHRHKTDVPIHDGLLKEFGGKDRVKFVACGASHSVVVTDSDEIFAWGNGNSGQLGVDSTGTELEPRRVTLFENQAKGGNPPVAGVACGGRHTMVWLTNGNVFSFGNNYYAQLGYDFREETYKENQTKPTLLKFLAYRPVVQVSCGEKHSVFRFQDGAIACVGCNANGQIGMGCREEAVVPKILEMDRPIRFVASGANHNLAITDNGEVYVWGYGKAIGNKKSDVLSPELIQINTHSIRQVAGGSSHSVFLTESGTVLTLGSGPDGQLGFGNNVYFLHRPRKIRHAHLNRKIVKICAGESFSAAITENGDLFMWGKNSHIILPDKPPSYRIWNPVLINKRTKPIKSLYCGSWHAIAITGFPDPLTNNYSDTEDSDQEMDTRAMNGHHQNGDIKDGDGSSESDGDFADLPQIVFKKDQGLQEKEGTKLTIAEFYAQEDNETNYGPSAAGGKSHGKEDQSEYRLQIPPDDTSYSPNDKPESAKSRIIVQVPTPNVVNVATSPIPFSSSDSGSERASSPHHTLAKQNVQKDNSANYKNSFQPSAKTTKFEESPLVYRDERSSYPAKSIPYSYEREKSCISNHSHPAPIVQVSKRTADMFSLPRENTNFTSRQIDLTEVEYARAVNSSRAHEKQFWVNKLNEARSECNTAPNPLSLVPQDEFIAIDSGANKTAKYSESVVSRYGRYSEASVINLGRVEGLLDGTPTKMTRSSMSDYGKQFGTPEILEEARRAAKLPPRGKPTSSIPRKKTEANFALQISRSDTIVAPLKGPIINAKMKNLKLNPLERYASVHNPLAGSKMVEKKSKAGIQTPRNVSIPGGRSVHQSGRRFLRSRSDRSQ
ncbi:hypothetical protein FSP39_010255 [Pinctada imbricata]|uniref:RCC1-like domain-containing protein n=1 Tax=Pinctada imbricata TaxID=66713 RepID=A0AA88Y377_PINIB|nr:hypothetical protein FSP39_010255 [Pinctada imbricata]